MLSWLRGESSGDKIITLHNQYPRKSPRDPFNDAKACTPVAVKPGEWNWILQGGREDARKGKGQVEKGIAVPGYCYDGNVNSTVTIRFQSASCPEQVWLYALAVCYGGGRKNADWEPCQPYIMGEAKGDGSFFTASWKTSIRKLEKGEHVSVALFLKPKQPSKEGEISVQCLCHWVLDLEALMEKE